MTTDELLKYFLEWLVRKDAITTDWYSNPEHHDMIIDEFKSDYRGDVQVAFLDAHWMETTAPEGLGKCGAFVPPHTKEQCLRPSAWRSLEEPK